MTLAEFHTARLDEDEAAAKAVAGRAWYEPDDLRFAHYKDAAHIARFDPARMLREVAAKRRRLERYVEQPGYDLPDGVNEGRDPDERLRDEGVKDALETEVREDAAIYDSHPDYDPAWRPE